MVTVKVDAKGRLSIPANIREEIDMNPGDVYFLETDLGVLHLAKAENPFDELAKYAIEEYERGETISLEDYAKSRGFDLSADHDES